MFLGRWLYNLSGERCSQFSCLPHKSWLSWILLNLTLRTFFCLDLMQEWVNQNGMCLILLITRVDSANSADRVVGHWLIAVRQHCVIHSTVRTLDFKCQALEFSLLLTLCLFFPLFFLPRMFFSISLILTYLLSPKQNVFTSEENVPVLPVAVF